MLDDNKPVSGRKGGGKGGGSSRTPYEAPDNLLTDSTAYLIDVVSEGEIEGWADADNPGTCIFFDDTPLQNADGSFNFEGVEYWLRTGTPDQEPVPGFSAVENEVGVSVQVEAAQPVVRSITAPDVDAVRVKVGVTSLSTLNAKKGDLLEAAVEFAIDIQAGSGGWQPVGTHSIHGKTTSGYQRANRIELPEVRPISIRIRRITPDSESSSVQDDLYFVSYTEIIDAKLRYPDTAYVALAVPASAFGGRVPRRSYRLKGVKCWVPSNYDPETRTYDENIIWDGTFKRAFTSNPAFLTYTVLIENRWGLGERIAPELVDKWRIYQIGKYCDELVPDGLGGTEPRFTMNGVMNTREAAYQVITQLSSAFRGVTYWGAGAVVPVQDAPADPVKIVTNANVVDGAFNYAGTSLSARKTAVVASYRHAQDHFKVKAGLVFEDHDAMQRYGRRQMDTTLPFTTSRGEALRTAKWIVDTNLTSQETVNYQAGFDHAAIRPGDKLLISDKHRIGFRVGGRIVAVSADRLSVTLDAPVSIEDGETYQLLIATDVGEYVTADVDAEAGEAVTELPLVAALPANVRAGAVFAMSATDMEPRLFRVVSNTPEKHLFNIVALEDDAEKYNRVELGINVADDAPYVLPPSALPDAPTGVAVHLYVKPDPGSKSKLRLLVSWSPPGNPLVTKYVIRMKEPNGPWREVASTVETSIELTPSREDIGIYQVRVFAVTVLGELSQPGQAQAENTNSWPRPATPTGWQGVPGHDSITLWGDAHPDPDFKAFVIYGATADDPTLLRLDEVTTTRYVRRVPTSSEVTRYAVTALNYNGDESFAASFIAVVPSPPTMDDFDPSVFEDIEAVANAQAVSVVEGFRSAEFTPAVTSLTAAQQSDRVDIDGILSRNEVADSRIDAVVIEQTRVGDALDTISEVATEAITLTSQTTSLVHDAGVRTDTETGEVYIHALRQQEGQLTTVEQRLDAAEGTLTQTATQIWVNSQIAAAQLDPAELAALDDLQLQVNTVEQELNAAQASITAKAEATFVDRLNLRLNTAETSLDALGLAITTKVESATFDAAVQRIQTAEETLDLIDVPTIRQQVSDIRRLSDDVDQLAYDSIEGLIDAYRAQDVLRTDFAIATQELQAGITESNEAIATAKTELAAGISGNTAQLAQEAQTRADADSAQASDIAALDVRLGDTETGLDTAAQAQQALEGRVAATETGQTAQASDITGLTTRIGDAEGGLVAETQGRTELTGRVETVEIGQTAQGAHLTALGSRLDNAETGQSAQGQALNQLTTRVDDAEGSISSQGAAITQIEADLQIADGERQATVSALNTVTGRVDDAEGVLSAHGQSLTQISAEMQSAEQERQANAQATQSLVTDVSQLTDGFAPLSSYDLYLEARIDAASETEADADLQDAAQAELGRRNTREDLALARQQLQAGIGEQGVALASAREELTARIGNTDAQVLAESRARADGDSALASDLSQVVARVTDAEGDITAQAGQISSVQANVTNLDGQLAASVQSVTTLSAQVGGHETLIQEQAQAVAGLGGTVQYLINTNGHIAGWALTNQVENGDPFAAFTFLADKFQISSVDGSSSPFIVYTQPTNVNGTVVPAGVYLKDAFIRNGIFDSAKIADVIQSANYQQGVSGWRILKSGQAEFNDVVISRDQVIDTGTLWIGDVPGAGDTLSHVGTWYAETNTLTGTWSANPSSFYVSVGRYGSDGTIWSNPDSYGTANIQWGWSGEVVPITRWSGAQRLWIRILFHARNVHNGTGFRVEWKLKRIT